MTQISGGRVLGPSGWLNHGLINIDNGVITSVRSDLGPVDHPYLVPGFLDLQVNGFGSVDLAQAPTSDWAEVTSSLAAHGVTAWLPTLISRPLVRYEPWLTAVADLADMWRPPQPRILGVHLEGPWLGDRPGAHIDIAPGSIDIEWVRALPDIVKIVTLAPERDGATAAIAEMVARGIVVSLGHTDASYEVANRAFDCGATMLTHCFNANPPLHHRRPGVVGAALARDDVVVSLIADGQHVHPDVLRIAIRAKGAGNTILVSDTAGWASGSLGSQSVRLVEGAPRTADGGLAGSALTLDAAVRFAVERCGVELAEAVGAVTSVPARLLGRSDIGRLAPGTNGDVVALGDDLDVRAVWIAGVQVG